MEKWTRTFPVSPQDFLLFSSVSQMTYLSSVGSIAPNRESKISKFSIEAYAVLEANTTQGLLSDPKLHNSIG